MNEKEKPALVGNAGDEEQVAAGRKKKKLDDETEQSDIRAIVKLVTGRRFLRRVLEKCSAQASIFSSDLATMAYRSGRQDLGHFLIAEIGLASPEDLYKILHGEPTTTEEKHDGPAST